MADIVLNDALGRIAEKVDDGADIILVPLSASDSDAVMKDGYGGGAPPTFLDQFLGAAGNTERTTGGWSRKTISNASLTVTIDDSADDVDVQIPDQTWTAVAASNDVVKLVVCQDGASDAVREVLTVHDFAVTTDGNDVVADFNATTGFWRSS